MLLMKEYTERAWRNLSSPTVRFNELKRYLKNISDKTLSSNLKELERDRLIERKEYPQIPPKVEYSLSDRGKSLMAVLDQLCVWGEQNKS